jgi:hypothetical protein
MKAVQSMSDLEIDHFNTEIQENPLHGFIHGNCSVTRSNLLEAMDEVELFVESEMDLLKVEAETDEEAKNMYESIISTVANFSFQLMVGTNQVVAERDATNSADEEIPPVLPVDLCNVSGRVFSAALQRQNTRLKNYYSNYYILVIDQQIRNLRIACREEEGLGQALDMAHGRLSTQSFSTCWSPLGNRFPELQEFCGGIASVMPGTASVKADFSVINWTKDPNSKQMTDFPLESILHCKQHGKLQKLFEPN